ncbi:MAG: ABC transporter substrate-binding protein [Desulfobacterota bacterium]|nr:ABC transporter substrate-binding protein [Thermodesulfobacteriota bacterium]
MRKIRYLFFIFSGFSLIFAPVVNSQETYKVGAAIALSGSIAVYGEGFKKAIDLATEEINGKGGIKGKKLEIIYEDNKSTPKDCVNAVRKLITVDKVPVIIGPAASSNFMAAAPVAQESKVVMISAQGAAPGLTKAGEYIFRVFPSDVLQGKGISDLCLQLKFMEVPIMYVNNDWGLGLKNVFVENFKKAGGKVLDEIPYEEKKTDYRTELLRATKGNPKAVVNLTYIVEGSVMFKQAYEMGIQTQWIVGSAAKAPKLVELAGKAVEGIIGTYPVFSQETKEYQAFRSLWTKKYGDAKIPIFAEYNYDMVHLIAKAIERGGYTSDGIRKALFEVARGYRGVTGDKTFDQDRGVGSEYGVWTIKDGQIIDYKK